ncbi:MAG: TIGR00269 family protein [Candidatus Aenigmatarchaeota archaeon]|nr:MAG: TIGR00269 family protein [Candidatus Aenigmarchaeota archaeon]
MKCRCGRDAIIFRPYEGVALCSRHFLKSFEKRVFKTIRKHGMLKSGDRVAVAISGGADSQVLLELLNKIISPRHDMEIFALAVDEGIEGYRSKTLKYAKALTEEKGIELHLFSFKELLGKTLDEKVREVGRDQACLYCSIGRRWILNRAARELGATKLATGHNLNDEAETILMNWIRGDLFRAARYGAITDWAITQTKSQLFIPRIKPLRESPESECTLYARLKGFRFSRRICPYKGGIRREIWRFLKRFESRHPGISFSILHTFDKLLPLIRQYAEEREGPLVTCRKCGELSSEPVCRRCQLWP